MSISHAVVVAGLPASGKSTFARQLAHELPGAVIVDKDEITGPVVRAALASAGQPPDLDGAYYKRWLSPASYEATTAAARAVVEGGATPIIVAPYEKALEDPAWPDSLRRHLGAGQLHVVWMFAARPTLHHRMAQRGEARDHSKLADWDAWAAQLPTAKAPPWPHVSLDTTGRTLDDLARDARELARQLAHSRAG